MKYSQKIPFGFTATQFEFGEEKLDYTVKGEKFDFGFVLPYEDIYPDHSIKTVSERWPLYVAAVFWVGAVLDRIAHVTSRQYSSFSSEALLFTFFALCLIFGFAGKKMRSDALSIKTSMGNIIILNDPNQKIIRDEIEKRRKDAIRKKYASVNPLNDPAFELSRLRKLKEEGILSDSEFSGIASQISIIKQ